MRIRLCRMRFPIVDHMIHIFTNLEIIPKKGMEKENLLLRFPRLNQIATVKTPDHFHHQIDGAGELEEETRSPTHQPTVEHSNVFFGG